MRCFCETQIFRTHRFSVKGWSGWMRLFQEIPLKMLNYVFFFYLEGLSSEQATCGGWNWLIVTRTSRTITTISVVKYPGFLWTPFLVCFGWVRVSVGFKDYCGGWLCFYISLGFIGMVTVPWQNQLQNDSETRQAGEERCIFEASLHGCFRKWWYPPNTPKWSFLVGKPMVVGYHHLRKPPHVEMELFNWLYRVHT